MEKTSHIIFDLDGVIYRGHTPIAGAADAVGKIRAAGIRVSFLTNNAARTRADLLKRLEKFGVKADVSDIMTSAYATACYLKTLTPRVRDVFVMGEPGLRDEIRAAGFEVLPEALGGEKAQATTFSEIKSQKVAREADALVSALDRKITYAKMASALEVLHSGAKWVACNLDPTLPMERGVHPGSGSLAASLAYAAGEVRHEARKAGAAFSNIILREPDAVVGKPNTYMLDLLLDGDGKKSARRSVKDGRADSRNSVFFVGDRLDMDIAFAHAGKLRSLLVLSGVTKKEEAKKAKGMLKPHAILDSVADVPAWLGIRFA